MAISFAVSYELSCTRPHLLYCNMYLLTGFLDPEIDDLDHCLKFEWPGPFCVKVCLGNGMLLVCVFWLSDKTVRKFAELGKYCQR